MHDRERKERQARLASQVPKGRRALMETQVSQENQESQQRRSDIINGRCTERVCRKLMSVLVLF